MKFIISIFTLFLFTTLLLLPSCNLKNGVMEVTSPDGNITFVVSTGGGQLTYSMKYDDKVIVHPSVLGFAFNSMDPLGNGVEIIGTDYSIFHETWEQVWGERRLVENHYHEMVVRLGEKGRKGRDFQLIVRAFNDGIGFRYFIPEQANIDSAITIMDELTEFNLCQVENAWWIPAYSETYYESLYRNTSIREMDTVSAPLTLALANGKYIAIHEASLTDYAAMNLFPKGDSSLEVDLTPWSTGEKVFTSEGMMSPWRTITIGSTPGDLITSYISLNLNEPCAIENTSWIEPGKYIGIWWAMHMGRNTWSQGPVHGATTENAMDHIDFAAKHGFDGVLIEGWNVGWDGDWVAHGDRFSFTQSYPDFDLEKVSAYARSKNVQLIGHHETGGAVENYESQLEDAFALYNSLGVKAVKTGYVRPKLEGKEFHSSQYGVRHYRKVIETAARYEIMIDTHEPVVQTGLRRTWPNLMTQEGVRGQEYNAWSPDGGNPPDHTTIIPFTRGLAGPIDFTPGIFNFENTANPNTRVQTTLAKQLALYVVLYSPLHMAADFPENYEGNKAFDFIKDVPVDWCETKVLDGVIGDYIITARKEKRSSYWFLGAITDEEARSISVSLDFLDDNKVYMAEIYADGADADWKTNPYPLEIRKQEVENSDSLILDLAAGGGQAIRLVPIER